MNIRFFRKEEYHEESIKLELIKNFNLSYNRAKLEVDLERKLTVTKTVDAALGHSVTIYELAGSPSKGYALHFPAQFLLYIFGANGLPIKAYQLLKQEISTTPTGEIARFCKKNGINSNKYPQ